MWERFQALAEKKKRSFPVGTFCALVIETRGYHDLALSERAD